jgi:hypothetical protein
MKRPPDTARAPAAARGSCTKHDGKIQAANLNSSDTTIHQTKQTTWRDKYRVHPAADKFPMMTDEELTALGEDIKANGLRNPIVFCTKYDAKGVAMDEHTYLLDGRNRLEAMERAGTSLWLKDGFERRYVSDKNLAEIVIGLNIRRRHLTKQQQADLIVEVIRASAAHRQVGEMPKRHVKGKAGSEKDATKAAAVAVGAQHQIGKRTIERSIAKAEGKTPKPTAVKKPSLPVRDREENMRQAQERRDEASLGRREEKAQRLADRKAEVDEATDIIDDMMSLFVDPRSVQRLLNLLWDTGVKIDVQDYVDVLVDEADEMEAEADEKAASTLPQDGRSERPVDDPTLENSCREIESTVNAALNRRRP